jgi:hypothetical protein
MKLLRNNDLFRSACFFAGFMCLISLLSLPMFSLVTVVRYAALIVAVWGVSVAVCQHATLSALKLAIAAIVMNPFTTITLDIAVLRVATVAAAVIFFASAVRLNAACLPLTLSGAGEDQPDAVEP